MSCRWRRGQRSSVAAGASESEEGNFRPSRRLSTCVESGVQSRRGPCWVRQKSLWKIKIHPQI